MTAAVARTVDGLYCRDHGGDGPPLVLLHGAGMSQHSLDRLTAALRPHLRVVTFDFRGHGRSAYGSWSMDGAIADLDAVIDAYRLDQPVVAGHSLGGMVAAEHARRQPRCRGAINLDGSGMGQPDQYLGKDEGTAAAWISAQQARGEQLLTSPATRALSLVSRLAGRTPADPTTLLEITRDVAARNLMHVYEQVTAPLLIVSATAAGTGLASRLAPDPDHMHAAFRAGLYRDLRALTIRHPNVQVVEIDATHMLITTHPAQTAQLITTFLGGLSPAA